MFLTVGLYRFVLFRSQSRWNQDGRRRDGGGQGGRLRPGQGKSCQEAEAAEDALHVAAATGAGSHLLQEQIPGHEHARGDRHVDQPNRSQSQGKCSSSIVLGSDSALYYRSHPYTILGSRRPGLYIRHHSNSREYALPHTIPIVIFFYKTLHSRVIKLYKLYFQCYASRHFQSRFSPSIKFLY